jgi:hypothetical protein
MVLVQLYPDVLPVLGAVFYASTLKWLSLTSFEIWGNRGKAKLNSRPTNRQIIPKETPEIKEKRQKNKLPRLWCGP